MTGLLLDFYCALVRPYAYIPLHGDGDGNGRGSEGHCGNYATNYGSGNGPGIPSLSISLLCLPLVCLQGRYQVYVVVGIKCMWCKLPVNKLLLKREGTVTLYGQGFFPASRGRSGPGFVFQRSSPDDTTLSVSGYTDLAL